MKVIKIETEIRYHVQFTEEETAALKHGGFLKRDPRPAADVHWTRAEIQNARALFPRLGWAALLGGDDCRPSAVPKALPSEKTAPAPFIGGRPSGAPGVR